ncbi:MAG: hypothetical protein ACLFWR_12510 [Acidimicrobiales bacterium]
MNTPLPPPPPPPAGGAPPPPPPPPPPTPRPWYRKKRFLIPGAVLALLVVVAISTDPEDEETAEPTAAASSEEPGDSTSTSDPDPQGAPDDSSEESDAGDGSGEATEPAVDGSRDAPLPLGQPSPVGDDYEVAVVGFVPDATSEVMDANQFNEAPAEGEVYSLVRVRATFTGDGDGMPAMDLSVGYVGDDGRVYVDHDCGAVRPDSMVDQPNLVAGGSAEGNFCLRMPVSVIGTGAIFVEPLFSLSDDKTWWAEQ